MDVIERHVRRLPSLDERWSPRPHAREDLATALLAGDVAGTATHPLDNVRANALLPLKYEQLRQSRTLSIFSFTSSTPI